MKRQARIFQRLPSDPGVLSAPQEMGIREEKDADAWMARIDQLLLSDPMELASFVQDALLVLAIKMKCEEGADRFGSALAAMLEAGMDERGPVLKMVSDRHEFIRENFAKTEWGAEVMMLKAYEMARKAPWPDEM